MLNIRMKTRMEAEMMMKRMKMRIWKKISCSSFLAGLPVLLIFLNAPVCVTEKIQSYYDLCLFFPRVIILFPRFHTTFIS